MGIFNTFLGKNNHSFFSTTIVQLVAIAAITPIAASHGARTVPMIPIVTGISRSIFPSYSFMMILLMFPSWINFFTVFTRSSEDTLNSSVFTLPADAPQDEQ